MVDHMNWKMNLSMIAALILLGLLINAIYVQSITTAQPIRVACVGDSITQESGYPTMLRSMLGRNYSVANFGVSGSTVSLDSKRPYMNQPEFQRAINYHPDIVIIMLGTNDANPEIAQSEENFENDYFKLINSFIQLDGDQLIWVVRSPPIFAKNSSYNNTYLENNVLPHVDKLANKMSLPTIDMYSTLGSHPDYFTDGVHPNDEGTGLIASNIYEAITLPDGSPDYSCFSNGYSG